MKWLLLSLSLTVTAAFGTHHAPARRRQRHFASSRTTLLKQREKFLPSSGRNSLFRTYRRRDRNGLTVAIVLEGGDIPVFSKTSEEHVFIRKSLLENVMFTPLPKPTLLALVQAFEKIEVAKDEIIVQQGEACDGEDFVYLVADGDCTVVVDGNVVPEPYGTLKPGSIFGEMGVLYNQTRAATIVAKSDRVTLFRVDGYTFKRVLNRLASDDDPDELSKIDQAINQVSGTKTQYGGSIIRQYKSNRIWLWTRWAGTIAQHNYKTTLLNMLFSLVFIIWTRRCTDPNWNMGFAPDKSHPFIQRLVIVQKIWGYQMSLTTFILTFFLNQAFSFWKEIHSIARRIQGRMNDFNLLLATSAKRNPDGTYTRESEKLMDDVGAYSRLFHALFWASCARRFSVLKTPRGMERMAQRGLMTSKQLEVLNSLDLPQNQKHNACIEWMMIRSLQGLEDGTLRGRSSLSRQLMDQICQLRATYATIGDKLSCRMPLAYTHFVQTLVDTFVAIAPVALYADLGAYSIFAAGLVTMFYTGLMDLAKM
jgi:predicted membrane chloride channel (bestrophin family)